MKMIPIVPALLLTLGVAGCQRAPPETATLVPPPAPRGAAPQARPETRPSQGERPALAALDSIPDALITARVRAGLLADPALAGADISVNTDRGVVALTGTVKDREQAAIASAHAQGQDGVMRIDNHLSVNAQ